MAETEAAKPGKKVLVVGLGVSGRAVCELLLTQGHCVIGADLRARSEFAGDLDKLERKGCHFHLGPHDTGDFLSADQIILSPGVPPELGPIQQAAKCGIEIVGELDWAWRQSSVPVVAVTGTNGKTTTTSLIGEFLKEAGRAVFVGGNIGTPLSSWILSGEPADLLVLEVSSFQLDTATKFRPEIGVLLNITEDHLDRYPDFSAYADSKLSLFARQTGKNMAIVNGDDPICRQWLHSIPGQVVVFSLKDETAHARVVNQQALIHLPGSDLFRLNLERTPLRGVHNQENILAAALVGAVLNIPPQAMQNVLDRYRGLAHRMEWVGNWRGIHFYDDSKATNVGAVLKALENFDRSVWLLLGGRDKLGSYEPLAKALRVKGKGALVFGEAAPRIVKELAGSVETRLFENLRQAFDAVIKMAAPGDTVLLSPACSSFDQFQSYAQRGDHFKELVKRLLIETNTTQNGIGQDAQ